MIRPCMCLSPHFCHLCVWCPTLQACRYKIFNLFIDVHFKRHRVFAETQISCSQMQKMEIFEWTPIDTPIWGLYILTRGYFSQNSWNNGPYKLDTDEIHKIRHSRAVFNCLSRVPVRGDRLLFRSEGRKSFPIDLHYSLNCYRTLPISDRALKFT